MKAVTQLDQERTLQRLIIAGEIPEALHDYFSRWWREVQRKRYKDEQLKTASSRAEELEKLANSILDIQAKLNSPSHKKSVKEQARWDVLSERGNCRTVVLNELVNNKWQDLQSAWTETLSLVNNTARHLKNTSGAWPTSSSVVQQNVAQQIGALWHRMGRELCLDKRRPSLVGFTAAVFKELGLEEQKDMPRQLRRWLKDRRWFEMRTTSDEQSA
jgi:hypothetical protein